MTHDTPRGRIPLMNLGPPQTPENMTGLGRNPHEWRGKAWQLRRVADLALATTLADHDATFAAMRLDDGVLDAIKAMPPTADGPFFLLAGLALENLLKGVIIAIEPHCITDGKLSKDFAIHDLLQLVARARIDVSDGEREFLEYAGRAVTTFSRYPIPLNAARSDNHGSYGYSMELLTIFDPLFNKIEDRIYDLRAQKRWPR